MNERAHCPYLGLRQNRAIRFAAPTAEHRCYVAGDAQDIPVDQRAYCLSGNHRTCPLYTGEWGATTSGAVGAGAALALPRRGSRARGGRDILLYLLIVGLILAITAVWLGIGYLYTLDSGRLTASAASAPAVVVVPTATPEPTVEPTVTPTLIATPAPPQSPTAVLGGDSVLLDWLPGPPPLTRGYNIQRSEHERGPWTKLNDELHLYSKYEDRGLLPDTQYFYRITTVDRDGRESAATTITVRTLVSTPTPTPEPPTATPEPTQVPVFIPPVQQPVFVPPSPTTEPPTPEPPTPEPPTPSEPPSQDEPLPPATTQEPAPPSEAPTAEAPTPEPPTPEPPTPEPATPEPPTPEPPTPEPPTPEPPTPEPSPPA